MLCVHDKPSLQDVITRWHDAGETVAFVPTMGNLHEGHLRLVDEAKLQADHCVVSIFVNPTQFGPGEDYDRYPRTEQQDRDKLAERGVDLIYLPDVKDVYPDGLAASPDIHAPVELNEILCGEARPGHFDGVASVVRRLLNAVEPDIAVFGNKDYQQLQVIRWLVAEYGLNVKIIGVPTARDEDGLALSSRNQYLSVDERKQATELYTRLSEIQLALEQGENDFASLSQQAREALESTGWVVDYVTILGTDLKPAERKNHDFVVLAAARLGATRLIDNIECSIGH